MAEPVIIHLHVPKCAGGSVNVVLERHFGERAVHSRRQAEVFDALTKEERDARVDCVTGHNRWGAGRKFNREVLYVSVTRDPVERLCSYFNFVHVQQQHKLHKPLQTLPDLSDITEDWLEAHPDIMRGWSNEACRVYSSGRFKAEDYRTLERRVMNHIRKGRFVVGPLPRVEKWFRDTGMLPKGQRMPHDKRTSDIGRTSADFVWADAQALSPRAHAILRAMNEYDYRLYEAIDWANYVSGLWRRPAFNQGTVTAQTHTLKAEPGPVEAA